MRLLHKGMTTILLVAGVYSQAMCAFVPRGLLIFLDDSASADEKQAISGPMQAAIGDNAGPILASQSLVQACTEASVENWIIKKVGDQPLYLLLPRPYLAANGISEAQINEQCVGPLSLVERKLGLLVNHMETTNLTAISASLAEADTRNYFTSALFNSVTKKSLIFCTSRDYATGRMSEDTNKPPIWSISMLGHGKYGEEIAGLRIRDFGNVLDFLEKNITTELLIYASCYSAGANMRTIYGDLKAGTSKTYSFAIICDALTDAPTAGQSVRFKHADFFKEIARPVLKLNYKKIVQSVIPLVPGGKNVFANTEDPRTELHWATTAQIRLPGLEWFSIMGEATGIVQLGEALAAARSDRPKLNVTKFFKTDPRVILLRATEIPFELVINATNLQAIVSMIPGDARHKLKKITSNLPNEKILDCFMAIDMLDPEKIFYIEELNDLKNVLIYNKKVPNRPGPFVHEDRWDKFVVVETADGRLSYKERGSDFQAVDSEKEAMYRHYLDEIQGRIQQIASCTITFNRRLGHVGVPELSKLCRITNVQASDFDAVCEAIYNKLPPEGIAWINQAQIVAYKRASGTAPAILTDVIFDQRSRRCLYFTCDGVFYTRCNYGPITPVEQDYRAQYMGYMSGGSKAGGIDSAAVLRKVLVSKVVAMRRRGVAVVGEDEYRKAKLSDGRVHWYQGNEPVIDEHKRALLREPKRGGDATMLHDRSATEAPLRPITPQPQDAPTVRTVKSTIVSPATVLPEEVQSKLYSLIYAWDISAERVESFLRTIDPNATMSPPRGLSGEPVLTFIVRFANKNPAVCANMVRLLLARGAVADATDADGSNALTYAMHKGPHYIEIAKLLMDHGVTKESYLLFLALNNADEEMVKLLLERGVRVENERYSWLGIAIRVGYSLDIIRGLVAAGASLFPGGGDSGTLLYDATKAYNMRPDVVQYLLEHGITARQDDLDRVEQICTEYKGKRPEDMLKVRDLLKANVDKAL